MEFRACSCYFVFFFFSSRRRHTRFDCDWSSDVCYSDLDTEQGRIVDDEEIKKAITSERPYRQWLDEHLVHLADLPPRSEERRVGKECRSRWSPDHYKKKKRADTLDASCQNVMTTLGRCN